MTNQGGIFDRNLRESQHFLLFYSYKSSSDFSVGEKIKFVLFATKLILFVRISAPPHCTLSCLGAR
jgi:hypothetical protein